MSAMLITESLVTAEGHVHGHNVTVLQGNYVQGIHAYNDWTCKACLNVHEKAKMSQYLPENTKTGNFNPQRTLSESFFVILDCDEGMVVLQHYSLILLLFFCYFLFNFLYF